MATTETEPQTGPGTWIEGEWVPLPAHLDHEACLAVNDQIEARRAAR